MTVRRLWVTCRQVIGSVAVPKNKGKRGVRSSGLVAAPLVFECNVRATVQLSSQIDEGNAARNDAIPKKRTGVQRLPMLDRKLLVAASAREWIFCIYHRNPLAGARSYQ